MSSDSSSPTEKRTRKSPPPSTAGNKKPTNKKIFQHHWYDKHPSWRKWLKEITEDKYKCYCLFCEKSLCSGYSEIQKHESSVLHQRNTDKFVTVGDRGLPQASTSSYSEARKKPDFEFRDRVKIAEIRIATFFVEHNIPYSASAAMIDLFQSIGEEPLVLQAVKLGRAKLSKIVNNVVCREETNRLKRTLQNTKFSVFVDETSDITNDKWFSIMVRYIEPSTLEIQARLLQLINLDARDCSADKIFSAFNNELMKKQIPLAQALAIGCDNASVMVGRNSSFRTKILEKNSKVITVPCICHLSALAASAACRAIPSVHEEFIKNIATFIHGSPKRTAIFREFQNCFAPKISSILRYAETRWLSRHKCIDRVLENWDILRAFLLEQSSENNRQATQLYEYMQNVETKAYLHFLHFVLEKFNTFNAEFQSRETKIHLLQPKSIEILFSILSTFIKPALLKYVMMEEGCININFSNQNNIMDIDDINVGTDCEEYLQDKLLEESLTKIQVDDIKKNCLQFLIKSAEEIRNRFPFNNEFFENLTIFDYKTALFDSDRDSSAAVLIKIGNIFDISNETDLKNEWFSLFYKESLDERIAWSKLSFDKMWIAICSQLTSEGIKKYPQLRLLLNNVRSLPHSNAEAERCFSLIPDVKTKKRNSISSATLNSICVIKSYLKCTNFNSVTMPVTKRHLLLTATNYLYAKTCVANERTLTLHGYKSDDEDDNDDQGLI
ncbi:protein FAM200A-like [Prorops nasuta]|uniref:protein FAM200A-like n=1 Tax=Prorops nasuta TaxID=863751 RepID=UPI0034CD6C6F